MLQRVYNFCNSGVLAVIVLVLSVQMTSTLPNPVHVYATGGTYTVTLTVDGLGGTDTEVKESYITVYKHGTYLPVLLRSR